MSAPIKYGCACISQEKIPQLRWLMHWGVSLASWVRYLAATLFLLVTSLFVTCVSFEHTWLPCYFCWWIHFLLHGLRVRREYLAICFQLYSSHPSGLSILQKSHHSTHVLQQQVRSCSVHPIWLSFRLNLEGWHPMQQSDHLHRTLRRHYIWSSQGAGLSHADDLLRLFFIFPDWANFNRLHSLSHRHRSMIQSVVSHHPQGPHPTKNDQVIAMIFSGFHCKLMIILEVKLWCTKDDISGMLGWIRSCTLVTPCWWGHASPSSVTTWRTLTVQYKWT